MPNEAVTERINLTLQDHNKKSIELPFKILVLTSITSCDDLAVLAEQSPVKIDDGIDKAIASQQVSLQLNVRNYLQPSSSDSLSIDYSINSLDDFLPDRLLHNIPELREALKLYDMLGEDQGDPGSIL